VSVQLVTTPSAVPSQTNPVFCVSPKFAPEIVTGVPVAALTGVTEEIDGAVSGAGATTVTVVVALTLPNVAVMEAVPGPDYAYDPASAGLGKTNATAAFDVVHVTLDVRSMRLPST